MCIYNLLFFFKKKAYEIALMFYVPAFQRLNHVTDFQKLLC
jgi:hypothetical protein